MSALRIIFILILVYIFIRILVRYIIPFFVQRYINRTKRSFYEENPEYQDNRRTDDGVKIKRTQASGKKMIKDDEGEYVDFEDLNN